MPNIINKITKDYKKNLGKDIKIYLKNKKKKKAAIWSETLEKSPRR